LFKNLEWGPGSFAALDFAFGEAFYLGSTFLVGDYFVIPCEECFTKKKGLASAQAHKSRGLFTKA